MSAASGSTPPTQQAQPSILGRVGSAVGGFCSTACSTVVGKPVGFVAGLGKNFGLRHYFNASIVTPFAKELNKNFAFLKTGTTLFSRSIGATDEAAATKITQTALDALPRIVHGRFILGNHDLNPINCTYKSEKPSSESLTQCAAAKSLEQPKKAEPSLEITTTTKQDATPATTSKTAPSAETTPIRFGPITEAEALAQKRAAERELAPNSLENSTSKAKEFAQATVVPVLTNYIRAYWLLTSVMGIELHQNGVSHNDTLMKVVSYLRETKNNEFSLTDFKEILTKNGIKPTFWQKIKLGLAYTLFGSWITKKLISSICDRGIEVMYDQLFGNEGKNQENLLTKGLDQISKLMGEYAGNLNSFTTNTTSTRSLSDFVKDLTKENTDTNKLFKRFARTVMDNFLPSISKNLIQPQIDSIKKQMGIDENSRFFTKITYFFFTLHLRFFKLLAWCIDTPYKKIVKSMIEDLGPTIVKSTMETLQKPTTKMKIKETILDLLEDLKKDIASPSSENNPTSTFFAERNSKFHENLRKLAQSISITLSNKAKAEGKDREGKNDATDVDKEDSSFSLDTLFKTLEFIPGLSERFSKEAIISDSLLEVIPQACIEILNKYLHPEKFTSVVFESLIMATTKAFAPADVYDHKAKLIDKANEFKLKNVITELSKAAIQNSLNDIVDKKYKSLDVFRRLDFAKVDPASEKDGDLKIEELVSDSLAPTISNDYIFGGINLIEDPNFIESALYKIMQIFVDLGKKDED